MPAVTLRLGGASEACGRQRDRARPPTVPSGAGPPAAAPAPSVAPPGPLRGSRPVTLSLGTRDSGTKYSFRECPARGLSLPRAGRPQEGAARSPAFTPPPRPSSSFTPTLHRRMNTTRGGLDRQRTSAEPRLEPALSCLSSTATADLEHGSDREPTTAESRRSGTGRRPRAYRPDRPPGQAAKCSCAASLRPSG